MELIAVKLDSELVTVDMIVLWGALTCFVFFVAGIVRRERAFGTLMKILALVLVFSLLTYPVVSRFNKLEILGHRVHLGYVWTALNKQIKKSDIESVTLGIGMRNRHCHVRLNAYSGDEYRSVVLSRDLAVCKANKAKLEAHLGL